jgi:NADPH-dependent 2,4-dienoyl-CoA reductase/sulfur reductase-like enzyme
VSNLDQTGRVVVVGGSIAGLSAVRELRRRGHSGAITVVDADSDVPYRRPDVSKRLLTEPAGRRTLLGWTGELGVELVAPVWAESLDVMNRCVRVATAAGPLVLPFEALVIATGARARNLPIVAPGTAVHHLRRLADADQLREALAGGGSLSVVGGGLIGLEVAAHLAAQGTAVTVIETDDVPLGRVLGHELATFLVDELRARGVRILTSAMVSSIEAQGSSAIVTLVEGVELAADHVLVAVGATPEIGWLAGSGADLADGIECDADGRVLHAGTREPIPGIVACGDVARWHHPLLEHWNNAIEQGSHVAATLLGQPAPGGFSAVPYFWSDQRPRRVQFLGAGPWDRVVVDRPSAIQIVAEYYDGDRLVAVAGVDAGAAVMTRRDDVAAGLHARAASLAVQV